MDKKALISRSVMKTKEILQIASIIYTIRRLNFLPIRYSKPLYILGLSPLLLVQALWNYDTVSYTYRRFLMSFTYPECQVSEEMVFRTCKTVHRSEKSCFKALKMNVFRTIKRVFRIYSRIYFFKVIFQLILSKNKMTKDLAKSIVFDGLKKTLRSTAHLAGQTLLQRSLLCTATAAKIQLTPAKLYALSAVGSLPVLFERTSRVKQVNDMVLSHLVIGQWKRMNHGKRKISVPILGVFSTILSDNIGVMPWIMVSSVAMAIAF